ncbi:MAG: bifunctional alpha/beta hydrolase/OsmC family protein [Alphaproteobacteria bacterium]|nr:bifunctional alpha/beta hydrolase/OsmC family protein [Alphaproteobacteria bacterium]
MPAPQRISFPGANGHELAARLDLPEGAPRAYALFAHCFTCSKDLAAARRIAQGLAEEGIGVLRFDFTGLGHSDGEFANTNFSSNVADLISAADYMRANFAAPSILIGHSLGGAAVLAAAGDIAEVKAVATIGAPSDVGHVLHQFGSSLDEVAAEGEAHVTLGGRPFTIKRQFIEDAGGHDLAARIGAMKRALLVLHSPTDEIVGIKNASAIFTAAKHPKSFVSLDNADHLLTRAEDAAYAARVISAWAARFLSAQNVVADQGVENVVVTETGAGKFQNSVRSGTHVILADEPKSAGGLDSGPSPYDFLSIALGACTSMTLRMYADRKKLGLGRISVEVRHGKVDAAHCEDCEAAAEGREGRIDRFERIISVDGELDDALRDKLVEIAGKCPVHRTLEASSAIVTRVAGGVAD